MLQNGISSCEEGYSRIQREAATAKKLYYNVLWSVIIKNVLLVELTKKTTKNESS